MGILFSAFSEVAIQMPITGAKPTTRTWGELFDRDKFKSTSAHTMALMILTYSECRLAREVSPRGSA
jgi:hypothetical protein